MIDLHFHSYFSDGEFSPDTLLEHALEAKLKLMALTDHDTISGVEQLITSAQKTDIKVVPGIEFSVKWKKQEIHIVGLNFDLKNTILQQAISQQQGRRIERASAIAAKLEMLGVENVLTKVKEIAGHHHIGRPHFAKLLLQENRVKDMQAAFKRFLGRGKPAYIPTQWMLLEQAVAVINQAGGQAVLAHPLKYGLTRSKLRELILFFKTVGGSVVEVCSGEMSVFQINEIAGLCQRFELLASSGSDFHGQFSRVKLGQQRPLPLNCQPVWHQWTN